MTNNVYGIDLGTCNMKIYCKASNKIMNEKNTIALVNKNEMYAYGDDAYAMYEKAPETIQVTFPVVGGVIADFNNLQVMLQTYLEAHAKGKLRGAEFIVAVPTDITDVEKRAFFDMFYKSKLKPKSVLLCEKPIADAVGIILIHCLIRCCRINFSSPIYNISSPDLISVLIKCIGTFCFFYS